MAPRRGDLGSAARISSSTQRARRGWFPSESEANEQDILDSRRRLVDELVETCCREGKGLAHRDGVRDHATEGRGGQGMASLGLRSGQGSWPDCLQCMGRTARQSGQTTCAPCPRVIAAPSGVHWSTGGRAARLQGTLLGAGSMLHAGSVLAGHAGKGRGCLGRRAHRGSGHGMGNSEVCFNEKAIT